MRLSLFLILVSAVAAQFEGFGGDGPKFCAPYQCPKDQEPVPRWPLKLSSMGCSGMGGMQVMSQATASGEDDPTKICCDLRHACLQTCGSLKSFCDEEYLKCGKEVCQDISNAEKRSKCESSSSINDIMIKMDSSCKRYDAEQYTHCECVPRADAAHKRERVLRAFYKKFNADAVDKVPALAKKADTTAKMVGLLLKLYKKYPAVIQKIKDPQQEYMEKMMRDAKNDPESEDDEGADDSDVEDLGVDEL
jgi:hypothetical protein